MGKPGNKRAATTGVFSVAMVIIGIAMVVRTITEGGGPLASGVILGVLFAAAGAGRFYIGRVGR